MSDGYKVYASQEYVNAAVASSGINEVPSNYIWELESGVYHISQSIFYSQNAEGEQELIFCKDGYIVITVDKLKYRRNFRLFAEDGKVYYGYSEPRSINTGNGIQTIVNSNLEILDLSNYATKEYVTETIDGIEIPDVSKFITEVPSEYITETELNDKGYLTEHQSLEGLATEDYVDTKVTTFHATLSPVTTQYIKDSGDFTYADVLATENCKIEATFGNIKIILNKEVVRNIEPDPVAGRYVEFSAILRNGPTTVKVFLFVYDPENLPTDAQSIEILKDWGDSQYCGIAVQHIVIGDFLDNDIEAGKNNIINAPSTKAIHDYVVTNFEQNSNKVQNLFDYSADETKYPSAKATFDLMKYVYDLVMPVAIYDDPTGFEANNKDVGDWQLTGLDLTPYKRLKFYVKAGGDSNDNRTPMHIVEMHLDDRCKNSIGFTAGHASVNPNNRNRIHCVTFAVNEAKTAVQFVAANSLYGTASTNSSGGRTCYLIEGYYI